MAMQFFAPEFKPEAAGGGEFVKMPSDGNRLLVKLLTPATIGYEYWNKENKGVRLREKPEATPTDIRKSTPNRREKVKQFYAFIVYVLPTAAGENGSFGIMQVSQQGIKEAIYDMATGDEIDLGEAFAVSIKASGTREQVKYAVNGVPIKPALQPSAEDVESALGSIDLDAILFGGETAEGETVAAATTTMSDEDIAALM